ncbi:MAG: Peptide deformylase [Candidatus Shapirobacteria bacterium GW2011_GWF1_38_23]|nr:MAG: Peptide deformylase [Candidatus Shapirobacteria bacterium GW2011_GWF2_37_20]KKQ64905.1 MAG: Peptide deformylase [Candidatus Shapirobacteria bacterium GW2011_GWF1_38_23]
MRSEIVMFPNKILRAKTKRIERVDEKLLEEIRKLKKILEESENGAGLAATQIGISKSFLGIKDKGEVKILINPIMEASFGEKVYPKIISEGGGESDFLEGCLSFPDLYGTVKRFLKIKVSWEEIRNKKLETRHETLEGFEAIVWQHEEDHLRGVLFVDHIKEEGGKFYYWKDKEKIKVDVNEILVKEK